MKKIERPIISKQAPELVKSADMKMQQEANQQNTPSCAAGKNITKLLFVVPEFFNGSSKTIYEWFISFFFFRFLKVFISIFFFRFSNVFVSHPPKIFPHLGKHNEQN